MHRAQEQVRDFMRAMGQSTPNAITIGTLSAKRMQLRVDLILEECNELVTAVGERDDVSMVDALCDLLYVTYGFAVEAGIDLEPFFELVHEANMKKGPGPVREDGKKLKPEGWQPPDIAYLLEKLRQRHG